MKRNRTRKAQWGSLSTLTKQKPRSGLTIKLKREITHSKVINKSQKATQSRDVDVWLSGGPLACQEQGPGLES